MARNDVYLNINALSPADAVVTGQQDMTAATVPELVLGDTPTFNFYFTDNTNVWPSWAGNASYTLTWALSDAVAGDFSPAATTGNATPITGGWSVVLPLNSYDLVGLLNTKRVGQPYPVTNLWQQLRVTDPSGNEVTRAMFWTPVRYRAISDTQNTESASPTGGRFVAVNNLNALTTPTSAQFYSANPVPTSALGTASNGELLIGNGTGFTKATLTAGSGVSITNGSGSITISATDGDITLDDGTAAAPSLKFTADTDTGIYRPSDNVLGISAGGVSRATFGATSAINGTTIPGSKTLVVTTDKLSALAATTSAELAGVISDETGTGALVFANTPTLVTPNIGAATGTSFNLTGSGTLGTTLTVNGTTDSSSKDTGAIITEGGLGVEKSASIGGNLTVSGTGGITASASFVPITALGTSGSSGSFVSDGHLNDLQGNTSQHFLIKRAKSTTTQSRWAFQLQGGENPGDSPVGGSELVFAYSTAGTGTFTNSFSLTRTGNATLAGNLTVSGGQIALAASSSTPSVLVTQTDPAAYSLFRLRNTGGTAQSYDFAVGGSGTGSLAQKFYVYDGTAGAVRLAIAPTTGNLLVGTTTDSGNGRFQLANHTTSAGGIGFGTDFSLYRSGTRTLTLEASSSPTVVISGPANGSTVTLKLGDGVNNDQGVITSTAGDLVFKRNATTALTLDSSQNATFAGQVLSSVNAATATNLGSFVASNATLNAFVSYTSGASADQKYWSWQSGSAVGDGVFRLRALNDAGTNGKNAIVVKRTGISSVIVNLPSLPTSSAGLAAGDLWNDSGTVKVV